MKNKLILVEGLPGSGKTTTAKQIHKVLSEKGIPCTLFNEGNVDHPADYEGVACLSKEQYQKLLNSHQGEEDFINSLTKQDGNDHFIYYVKQYLKDKESLSAELMDDLELFDVYKLPLEKYREVLLKRWERFGKSAETEDRVYIFECAFLQNPLCTLMARDDRPYTEIRSFITKLFKTIENLNPLLIYCNTEDVDQSFRKVKKERPEGWYEFSEWYYTKQAYGKNRKLEGLDGVIAFLKERKDVEIQLLEGLPLEKIIITNKNIDETNKIIKDCLGIKHARYNS